MRTLRDWRTFSWLIRAAQAFLFAGVLVWSPVEAETIDVGNYISRGYSVVGPIRVESVSSKSLELYALPKNILVALEGRNVSMMTLDMRRITLAQLERGSHVYVLQRGEEVIVYSLPAKEVRYEH
ncbi:MAG: hypothetical protein FJY85_06290 [Deltaproteobacteria bacterium]|nr:hypothetical protein [Deltaproteobacteria bacterium]